MMGHKICFNGNMDNYLKIDPVTHSYLGYGSVQYKALSVIGSDNYNLFCLQQDSNL